MRVFVLYVFFFVRLVSSVSVVAACFCVLYVVCCVCVWGGCFVRVCRAL
jgi:hypothetical protein